MFEPKSMIQRVVDMFSYGPIYLKRAAQCEDPLERFKLVIAVSIAGMHLCIGQLKPFNPILGETMEGHFSDGCRIYAEHTSHHPPITHYLLEDAEGKYKFYGSAEMTASLGANNLKAGQEGDNFVEFTEFGHKIRVNPPKYILGGTVMGDRTMNVEDAWVYHDETHGFKAVIIFNPIMKSGGMFSSHTFAGKYDDFRGVIYKPDPKKTPPKSYKKFKDINDIKESICFIEGSWI